MSKVRLYIAYESQPLETAFSLFQKKQRREYIPLT